MRSNALPLTEEQLALVRAAANAVPARWRTRYLGAVVDLLTGRAEFVPLRNRPRSGSR
jgi:hypothetical protein